MRVSATVFYQYLVLDLFLLCIIRKEKMQIPLVCRLLCSVIVLFSCGMSQAMMRGLLKDSRGKLQRALNVVGSRQTNAYKAVPHVLSRGLSASLAAMALGSVACGAQASCVAWREGGVNGAYVAKSSEPLQLSEEQKQKEFVTPYFSDSVLCEHFIKKCMETETSPFDYIDSYGRNPLMAATSLGRLDLVQLLMDNGGIVRVNDRQRGQGEDALVIAITHGHVVIVRYFLDNHEKFDLDLGVADSYYDSWMRHGLYWKDKPTAEFYIQWRKAQKTKKLRAQKMQELDQKFATFPVQDQ